MTLTQYRFETGPQGAAINNANSGSTASSVGTGSSVVFDTGMKAHGVFGARFINGTSANCYRRYPMASPGTVWQFSGVITLPASAPAANLTVMSFCNAAGAGRLQVYIDSSLRLGVQGVGGAGTTNITSSLTAGDKYRLTLVVSGGSTTASTVSAKVYSEGSGAWTTQVGSTWTSSTYNTGTDQVIGADVGIVSSPATSYTVGWDDVQLNDGAGGEIDDLIATLSTPVVTLGATTNPSTVGGTNGTQVVSWSAISGSSSYEAWLASGSTPAQGDFTRVATGVTSPYTFTGLSAGEYSFGIKAKA